MLRLFTCPHGHSWEAGADQGVACPVCGAMGDTDDAAAQTDVGSIDELPPPPMPGAKPAAAPSPHWPKVPGYEILGELGRGGMGVVYRAQQLSLRRLVALKMLPSTMRTSPEAFARFRAEAETIAQLQHPNIVHVYDVIEYDGAPCFAMEYIDGGTLDEKLAGRPMPADQAAHLVRTLARAVQAAHERGIIHRDLKPANILIAVSRQQSATRTKDGLASGVIHDDWWLTAIPKITDFGLAKRLDEAGVHTRSGFVMGTPHYMAPEQAEGAKSVGPAADVYALGAILYETLTGAPPFRGDSAAQVMKKVLFDEPAPPGRSRADTPPALETICMKCLRKNPAQRYGSAGALADELDQFLAVAAPDFVAPGTMPTRKLIKRSRIWATAFVLALLFATMLAFVPEVRHWVFQLFQEAAPVVDPMKREIVWQVLASPGTKKDEAFDRLAFPSRATGYLASRLAVYKTTDNGTSWISLKLAPTGRVHVLHFKNDNEGWLGSDKLQQTSDGGATWDEVPLAGTKMRAVTALASHRDGWTLAGGTTDAGGLALFRRASPQAKWERLALAGDLKGYDKWSLGSLSLSGPVGLAVLFDSSAGGGAVFRLSDQKTEWKRVFTAEDDLYRVRLTGSREAWVVGLGGLLWHSTDAGEKFLPVDNPDAERATPACVAFDGYGQLGLAPLWKRRVLVKVGDEAWKVLENVPLDYAMTDAAVVDAGCAYVLGADGKVARFLDLESKTP